MGWERKRGMKKKMRQEKRRGQKGSYGTKIWDKSKKEKKEVRKKRRRADLQASLADDLSMVVNAAVSKFAESSLPHTAHLRTTGFYTPGRLQEGVLFRSLT